MANAFPEVTMLEEPLEEIPLVDDAEAETEEELFYDEDSLNLVPEFEASKKGQEELSRLCDFVIGAHTAAWEASTAWRDRAQRDWVIFSGDLPDKDQPWQDAANVMVPIMMENLSRLQARMYGELFGDWQNVYGVKSLGPDDDVVAKVLSVHGNWQIRNEIPGFKRHMERAILAFLVFGDFTCHSYYDDHRKCNVHEVLTPDTFVTPFEYTSVASDYSDLPWYSRILHKHRHELQSLKKKWSNIDTLLEGKTPTYMSEPDQPLAEAAGEVIGVEADDSTKGAPYKLIQWEGWFDLPASSDSTEESRDRFVQVIVHAETRTVLYFTIHEENDWKDQRRYDQQLGELMGFQQAVQQHEQHMAAVAGQALGQRAAVADAFEGGVIDPAQADMALQTSEQMALGSMPPEPTPPTWMQDGSLEPKPVRKVPIYLFTHGVCIEPLTGNVGLGYGRVQADFTRAANIAMNQFVDAGTLANCKSFCLPEGVEFAEADPKVTPGKIIRVKGLSGMELKNSIIEFNFPPANPQLVEVCDKLYQFAQSSIQAPNVLSGEPGKSGETYRGLSARIEQATKQLSVVTRKFADVLEEILKRNAALNARFLEDEQVFAIQNHDSEALGAMQEYIAQLAPDQSGGTAAVRVARKMYERDYRVEIRADLRFATQAQRIGEADELLQLAMTVPPLQQNLSFQYSCLKQVLKARGLDHMIPLLGAPPPPAQMFGEQQVMMLAQQMVQAQMGGAPPGGAPPQGGPPQ